MVTPSGGRFVHELASALSDRFLAYTAVSSYYGNVFSGTPSGPPAGTMVPFFLSNTLTDTIVPYGGSAGFPFYTPAQDAYDGWYMQFVSVDNVTTSSHHAWPTFANSGYETTNGMVGFWDAQ